MWLKFEKFYKISWELNKAQLEQQAQARLAIAVARLSSYTGH